MVTDAHLYNSYIIFFFFGCLEFFVALENFSLIAVEGLNILISYLKEVTCNGGLVSQITQDNLAI